MNNNDLALIVLTSTRQHYNWVDVDKFSISRLLGQSKIFQYNYKLVHIKKIIGDDAIALDKRKWFEARGFEVLETEGNWSNDHESHAVGLAMDMAKVYNHLNVLKHKYVLHAENDWTFNVDFIDKYFIDSMSILDNNPELIYHRYSRVDQSDIIQRLDGKPKNDFYITNREFSFNPFIGRARDMKYISNFVLNNYQNLHPHIEMKYEQAAHYLNRNKNIFSFTHNQIIEHIGTPEFTVKYNI